MSKWNKILGNILRGQKNRRLVRGFTLIEALVGIFIILMIGAAALTLGKNIFSFNSVFQTSLISQDEARRAFSAFIAEARSSSPSSLGSYSIATAATSTFTFYSDVDDDGLKERLRYFLSGKILKKGVLKPVGSPFVYNEANEVVKDLVHDISNGTSTPIFEYYDTNYDGSSSPLSYPINILSVRLVKVTLKIDRYSSRAPSAVTMTTQVSIRNLKDNL